MIKCIIETEYKGVEGKYSKVKIFNVNSSNKIRGQNQIIGEENCHRREQLKTGESQRRRYK